MKTVSKFLALTSAGLAFQIAATGTVLAQTEDQEPTPEVAAPSPNEGDSIVVSGNRLANPEQTREIVKEFVRTVVRPPAGGRFEGQMARLLGPVCPAIYGLSDADEQAVESRMREVALAAELEVAGDGCQPNLNVVLVDDGSEMVGEFRTYNHHVFGGLPIWERRKLQESDGPVFGWKSIQAVPAGSTRVRPSSGAPAAASLSSEGAAANSLGNDGFKAQATTVQSLFRKPTELAIMYSVLLIEREAVADLSLLQLADFGAIYSLMDAHNTFDPAELANPSILTLFEDKKRDLSLPQQVTEWDLAVVHALYHSTANLAAHFQMSEILQKVEAEAAAYQAALEKQAN